MAWGIGYLPQLKIQMQALFIATYRKPLIISSDVPLIKYINARDDITDVTTGYAHFSRIISYYHSKYPFVPSLTHLLSDKVALQGHLDKWKILLSEHYPAVLLEYSTSDTDILNDRAKGHNYLISDASFIAEVVSFSELIIDSDEVFFCTETLAIFERALASLLHRENNVSRATHTIYEAYMYVQKSPNLSQFDNWVGALLESDKISFYGELYSFWELPKLIVSRKHTEHILYVEADTIVKNAIVAITDFYKSNKNLIRFISACRDEYVLDLLELKMWEDLRVLPQVTYPHRI